MLCYEKFKIARFELPGIFTTYSFADDEVNCVEVMKHEKVHSCGIKGHSTIP